MPHEMYGARFNELAWFPVASFPGLGTRVSNDHALWPHRTLPFIREATYEHGSSRSRPLAPLI